MEFLFSFVFFEKIIGKSKFFVLDINISQVEKTIAPLL